MAFNKIKKNDNSDKDELRKRLAYEKMVADISSLAVFVEDLDGFQRQAFDMMAAIIDVSRIYLFRLNDEIDRMELIYNWVAEGIEPEDTHAIKVPLSKFAWGLDKLLKNEIVNYEDTKEIPSEFERNYILEEKTKSILVMPMWVKGSLYGYTGFDEVRFHRKWHKEDIDILKTITQIVAKAIESNIDKEEIQNHRSRLQAIFRSVDDAIITVDKDMKVIEANQSTLDICGLDPDLIIGRKIFKNPQVKCMQPCLDVLTKTLKTKETVREHQIECRHQHKERQTVVVTSSPLLADNGDFMGAVLAVRDISRLNQLERELKERNKYQNIVGKSREMQQVYALIEDLADLETTVLVRGASGTGKELVAKALHEQGRRAGKPIVVVNCSALAENLLESELFGHVKGAFTGAVSDKIGRFQMADGGTIVLDEIADISPMIQLKLLRVIQEKQFEQVGVSRPTKVDVRIIALTNSDLKEKVSEGTFRKDLYYRLKVMEIILPSLRRRTGDLPLLIDHFLKLFNRRYQKKIKKVNDKVLKAFMQYPWPGNVRELEHAIEHAFVLCKEATIRSAHIPMEILENISERTSSVKKRSVENEREIIFDTLGQTDWNKAKAARLLGMDRSTLYRKIQKYNISKI